MIQNLHTHTTRCGHAQGSEEEYISHAIEGGLKILGFSEHAPHIYTDGFISKSHMQPAHLNEYADTIRRLSNEYAGQIDILSGCEIEYYPALFTDTVHRLMDAGIEYLILGQHWIENQVGLPYLGRPTDDPYVLKQYCRQARDGMQTGLVTYFCHPDVINFTGDSKLYEEQMRLLCREANSCDLPIEYNLWGIRKKGNYPADRFWQMAAEENCKVVIGVDAHAPDILSDKAMFIRAEAYINALGMELIETYPIRRLQ